MGKRKNNASIACYIAMCEYRKKGRGHLSREAARVLKMLKRPYS
ncbi:hypothetical protein ACFFMS_01545 [Ectobacillus funiculus]|uniref:IS3 family transposase n=1 Tax=Ectobacillus funiculus TaxID=137993 RepID=A0ABV5WAD4_9BACI